MSREAVGQGVASVVMQKSRAKERIRGRNRARRRGSKIGKEVEPAIGHWSIATAFRIK